MNPASGPQGLTPLRKGGIRNVEVATTNYDFSNIFKVWETLYLCFLLNADWYLDPGVSESPDLTVKIGLSCPGIQR
jgi:hypothetical protein